MTATSTTTYPPYRPAARDRAADLADGRIARDAGSQAAFDANKVWRDAAQKELDRLVAAEVVFTCDDITDSVGESPVPNAMGGLFNSNRKRIKTVGFTQSTRKAAHARIVREWRSKTAADAA